MLLPPPILPGILQPPVAPSPCVVPKGAAEAWLLEGYTSGFRGFREGTHYVVDPQTGCWNWLRCTVDGYGQQKVAGKMLRVHRMAWILSRGPIPEGQIVCHTCDNRRCLRPDHLWLGSHLENHRDAMTKGRHAHGETHYSAVLTARIVRACRRAVRYSTSTTLLAGFFGVAPRTMRDAVSGRTWRRV